MGDELLERILGYIHDRSRLVFAGQKKRTVRKKVMDRIDSLGHNPEEYWRLLVSSREEERKLIDLLTVNETCFFRNGKQFDYLMKVIIPAIEANRGEQVVRSWGEAASSDPRSIMKIRIMSAGCSTGEEPYSIAMALLESLKYHRAWDARIYAGDISDSCLAAAREGFYEEKALQSLPPAFRRKYVEPVPGGGRVSAEVRSLVSFSRLNLQEVMAGGAFPGAEALTPGFDLVFCRNVMIYFPFDAQQHLVTALSSALVPGGYLFTGDAEPLHLYNHDLKVVPDAGCLIYRKGGEN